MLLLVTDYFTSITECQLEYSLHLFGGWCPCCDVCHHWQYSETVSLFSLDSHFQACLSLLISS